MKRATRFLKVAAVTGAVLVTAPVASRAEGYDAELFHPHHDGTGAFTTYGGEPLELWAIHADMWVDHSRRAVALETNDGDQAMLVTGATQSELGAMVGLPLDMEAGFAIPYVQQTYINPIAADGTNGTSPTGWGDPRVIGKWSAFRSTGKWVPNVGFAGEFTIPAGSEESWHGAGAFQPSFFVIGQQNVGPVDLIGNLGYRAKSAPEERVWGTAVDDLVCYKLAAVADTGLFGIEVLTELNGATAMYSNGVSPLEAGLGLRRDIWGGFNATAGVNKGITGDVGTPTWRWFAGIHFKWGGDKNLRVVDVRPEPVLAVATPVPTPGPKLAINAPTPVPTAKPVATPEPAPVARVTQTNIEINQTIHFKKNSAVIEDSSFAILDLVVLQLKAHPEILKLSIEGHTDSTGNALFNLYLSKVRANSVRNYMTTKGVEANRLDTAGWGHEKPMADNRTKDGRQMNRRVEFKIEKRKSTP